METRYVHDANPAYFASPQEIVPFLLDLFEVNSVIDVGCGPGYWLKTFALMGVEDYLGVDGAYVDRSMLVIDPDRFIGADLEQPFSLDRTFDLVVSVEVAEHLRASAADTFVESLTALGDIILFSAAVPHQGGQNHVNEQWPAYWVDKFARHRFVFYDPLRPVFWNNPKVYWWYRQNMFLIIRESVAHPLPRTPILPLVHPELFKTKVAR